MKSVLPAIQTGVNVAKLLGLGEMDGEGRKRRGRKKGRGIIGGADEGGELVTRSQLKNNLY